MKLRRIPHPKKLSKDQEKIILNYRLEEVIGYGAWGKVKKGWNLDHDSDLDLKKYSHNSFDGRVAIKILRKRRISRKIRDGINKIYQEFDLLSGLDHECIVKYYDLIETDYADINENNSDDCACACDNSDDSNNSNYNDNSNDKNNLKVPSSPTSSLSSSYSSTGFKDGKIYLIMEWLGDGCNLYKWIQQNPNPSTRKLQVILRQVLEALEYLNIMEITHHDIKLDNVIFNEQKETVKIIDFGVSESCPGDESFCAFGTPAYQSPELLLRSDPSKPISGHKIDTWSVGIVAYQLAHEKGKLPFEGESLMEVFDKIIHTEPDYSLIKNQKLRDLIKNLLKKNPKRRLSASEALKHPFITIDENKDENNKKNGNGNNLNFFQNIFNRIKLFVK